jgi:hypothetical protein
LGEGKTQESVVSMGANLFSVQGFNADVNTSFALSAPQGGEIYFTLDGSDPRQDFSAAVSQQASKFDQGEIIHATANMCNKARVLHQGRWSALLATGVHIVSDDSGLNIAGIMCHPANGIHRTMECFRSI